LNVQGITSKASSSLRFGSWPGYGFANAVTWDRF